MLRVKAVPAFLNNSCTDGVSAALLMSTSGALLGMGAGTGMGAGAGMGVGASASRRHDFRWSWSLCHTGR